MKQFIVLFAALMLHLNVHADIPMVGRWQGALKEIRDLKMSFNITEEGGKLNATLDVPTQGAKDLACTEINITPEDSVFIKWKMLNAEYVGKLVDVNKIDGVWVQNGLAIQLVMTRTIGRIELNRPQTPKPPYSYYSEDILFYNANKSMYYGATITTPKDDEKHPALILISGSGPQNRDEELFDHKPFAVVADYLTKKGYVVLRVDDRGVGKTGGDRTNATSADYAKDVVEAINYLKTRPEVDKKKIGLYGHSEGGLIAQLVAAENKDVNFIIMMAAPGVKVTQGMTEQNIAILKSAGISNEVAENYGKLYHDMVTGITVSTSREEAQNKIGAAFDKWKSTTDTNTVKLLTGVSDSASREMFVFKFVDALWNKWMVYFMQYDPKPVLEKLNCKVLALNGDKDIQVLSRSNLEGIQKALAKSKSKDFETREVQGVNHLFQECKACTAQEYGELEQTLKPEVLEIVGNWLDEHVK